MRKLISSMERIFWAFFETLISWSGKHGLRKCHASSQIYEDYP